MKTIHYITENNHKFETVRAFLEKHGIEISQKVLPIYEIQSKDGVEIAKSKAKQAWKTIKEPLFVNDAFWIIPSLKGFPGPYMKYMNDWLEPDDFLKLMNGKTDRTIILRDTIVYIDENGPNVFTNDYYGEILENKYEGDYKYPLDAVASLSKNKKSIAEENGIQKFSTEGSWADFAKWLKNNL